MRELLDAELFVSEVLGTWWGQRLPEGDVEEVVGEALVEHAARSDDPTALALLLGIERLGTPGQSIKARSGAQRLAAAGVRPPPWAERIGRVEPGDCWVSRDVYGDQDSLVCTFHHEPGGESHALVVLLDYNLHGLVRDAWCTSKVQTLLDRCHREAAGDPLTEFRPLDPSRARALLQGALEETDRAADPPVTENFAAYHAFLRSRLQALPDSAQRPIPPRLSSDRRAAITVEFLASPEAENLSDSTAAGRCADLIIDHGYEDDLGRPLRVSPTKAEAFLLDWLPRKVMLRTPEREAMPHVLAAWVRWRGRQNSLPEVGTRQTLNAVWEASRRFEETYGDPSRIGLDSGTVDRLVPDGDLEALPRRAVAVPLLTGKHRGRDLGQLDPSDPEDRRVLVSAEHPERGDATHAGLGVPTTDGGADRAAHLRLHEVVAAQLWEGSPPETWEAAQRLLDRGYERHQVLHMLMSAVDVARRNTQGGHSRDGSYDPAALRSALDELPRGPGSISTE